MTKDIDEGCGALDLIAHSDEGRQIDAINEEFADARRRVLSQGGSGKVTLTIKLTAEIKNADLISVNVGFEIKRPTRKQTVPDKVFLDTELKTDNRGMPTREIAGSTMHLRNPRQKVIKYPKPTVVGEGNN